MEKILFIATVESHILFFHVPFIKYFQEKGYEVHVAAKLGGRCNELEDMEVICHNICFERSVFSRNNIKAYYKLKKIMEENKFKLVHTHTPIASFIGRYAAKVTNTAPILYTAHGFHFFKGAPLKNWLLYYPAERIAARWTDGLITINNEDFEKSKKFKLRRKEGVFLVNGVGVDLDEYKNVNMEHVQQIKNELGITEDDFVMLCVAEFIKRKNQIQLIKTIQHMNNKKIKLLLVGTGALENELKLYAKKNNLDKSIIFLGYRSDIPELLAISDVLALTSYHEGLPKCIMEGMAAGKAIIATDVRGNRDLIANGENGYIVEIDDVKGLSNAIENLYKLEEIRWNFGNKSLELIKMYSIENIVKDMDKIYLSYLR